MADASVTIYVKVTDEEALIRAARARAIYDGLDEQEALEAIADGDVSSALRFLFDPGIGTRSCAGFSQGLQPTGDLGHAPLRTISTGGLGSSYREAATQSFGGLQRRVLGALQQ